MNYKKFQTHTWEDVRRYREWDSEEQQSFLDYMEGSSNGVSNWEHLLASVVLRKNIHAYRVGDDTDTEALIHSVMVLFLDMDRTAVLVDVVEDRLGFVPDWLDESGDWGWLRSV